MKKVILFLLVSTFCFTSCSKDDDGVSSSDKIIGSWGNYKDVYLPTGETDSYNPYYEIITYNSNGTVSSKSNGITFSGNWENLGNGIYKLSMIGISVNQKIEFMGNDEMIIYDSNTDDSWAYYYERIK